MTSAALKLATVAAQILSKLSQLVPALQPATASYIQQMRSAVSAGVNQPTQGPEGLAGPPIPSSGGSPI
jgi:hypothetical protein